MDRREQELAVVEWVLKTDRGEAEPATANEEGTEPAYARGLQVQLLDKQEEANHYWSPAVSGLFLAYPNDTAEADTAWHDALCPTPV